MEWAEKYRPEHLNEIVGNAQALAQILSWARGWSAKSKPLLLYGKPGVGKTSSMHALARDVGWEVVELNASDQRTRAVLEKIAGASARTATLSGAPRRLIILDEVDNLHGSADRGGAKALLEIIKSGTQPIALIANDLQGIPAEIRQLCEPVQFRGVQARSMLPRLKYICSSEGVRCSESVLKEIAEAAQGDMRAAISMLSAIAMGEREVNAAELDLSRKDERSTVFDLVSRAFRSEPDEILLRTAMETGEEPEKIQQWLESSLTLLHDDLAIAEAYRAISRADLFAGRVFRRQYYMLWRYAQAIALIGVSAAARGRGIRERIMPPERWKRMGALRRQKAIRSALLGKLSTRLHIPIGELRDEYITPISLLVEANPDRYIEEFSLDAEELNLFIHDRKRAAEIMKSAMESRRDGSSEGVEEGVSGEESKGKKAGRRRESRAKQATLF